MTGFVDVRTATASKEDADKIAHTLVSQRLAASAQVSGPIRSVYWWKGEIVEAEEWMITAKTPNTLYPKVEQAIHRIHPYEEPSIIAFPYVPKPREAASTLTSYSILPLRFPLCFIA